MARALSCSLLICLSCTQEPSASKPAPVATKAAPDTPKKAEAPLADLPGYPLKNLAPAARRPFVQIAQEELCGCENPRTLAGCLAKKEPCMQALVLSNLLKGFLENGVTQAQTQLLFSRLITDGMCADPIAGLELRPMERLRPLRRASPRPRGGVVARRR